MIRITDERLKELSLLTEYVPGAWSVDVSSALDELTELRATASALLAALDADMYVDESCGLAVSKHDAGRVTAAIAALRAAAGAGAEAPSVTPRDEWPTDADGALGHLTGCAFFAAPIDEVQHCADLIRGAFAAHDLEALK